MLQRVVNNLKHCEAPRPNAAEVAQRPKAAEGRPKAEGRRRPPKGRRPPTGRRPPKVAHRPKVDFEPFEGRPKAAEVVHKERLKPNLKHCESPRPKAAECYSGL